MAIDDLQRMALALALVLGLVLLCAALLRRFRGVVPGTTGPQLRVISSTYLGPKERLVVVQVRGQEWVLGVSAQQIAKLGEIDPMPETGAVTDAR